MKTISSSHIFSLKAHDLRKPNNEPILIPFVREFTFISAVRKELSKLLNTNENNIQLFHPNNPSSKHIELQDSQSLRDLKIIDGSGSIQYSINSLSPSLIQSLENRDFNNTFRFNDEISAISPSVSGTSGVYFLENSDHMKSAVFKPYDEEQGMINNPKGFTNKPLKSFFKPGQGIMREYASYFLDLNNFCKVPRTRLIHLEDQSFQYTTGTYPKYGALQDFVKDGENLSDFGPNVFSVFEIQKIALLDIRLLNCDRNDENVLVVKKRTTGTVNQNGKTGVRDDLELIPIDHGYCLPAQLRIDCWDWVWFDYPQVKQPVCAEIIEYMKTIDIEDALEKLSKEVSFSSDSLFLVRIVHYLLLQSLEKGLSLFDIASIVARTDETTPSPLEKMIQEAESNSFATIEARSGRLNSHSTNPIQFDSSVTAAGCDFKRLRSYSLSHDKKDGSFVPPPMVSSSVSPPLSQSYENHYNCFDMKSTEKFISHLSEHVITSPERCLHQPYLKLETCEDELSLSSPCTSIESASSNFSLVTSDSSTPIETSENMNSLEVMNSLSVPVDDTRARRTFSINSFLCDSANFNSKQLSNLTLNKSSIKSNNLSHYAIDLSSTINYQKINNVRAESMLSKALAGKEIRRQQSLASPRDSIFDSWDVSFKLNRHYSVDTHSNGFDETSLKRSYSFATATHLDTGRVRAGGLNSVSSASCKSVANDQFKLNSLHVENPYNNMLDEGNSLDGSIRTDTSLSCCRDSSGDDFDSTDAEIDARFSNDSLNESVSPLPLFTVKSLTSKFDKKSDSKDQDVYSNDASLYHVSNLRRMVSFAAPISAPMYDCDSAFEEKISDTLAKSSLEPAKIVSNGRRMPKKLLQQHCTQDSEEFQELKKHFAGTLISFLVKKVSSRRQLKV